MEIYHPKTLYPPPKYQSSNPFHQTITPHFAWKQKPKQHIFFLWGGGGRLLNPKKTTKTTFFFAIKPSDLQSLYDHRTKASNACNHIAESLESWSWLLGGKKKEKWRKTTKYFQSRIWCIYIYIPGTSLSSILVVVSPSKTRPKLQSKEGPAFGF